MDSEIYRAVAEALDRGEAGALITVVSTAGSTPQRVGAKMLAFADGRTQGTIGGGCYEHDALGKAREEGHLPQSVSPFSNPGRAGLINSGYTAVQIACLRHGWPRRA